MSLSFFKKHSLFLLFFFIFLSFFIFDLDKVFTLEFLRKNNNFVIEYVNRNIYVSIFFIYFSFLLLLFFFLPVCAIMMIFTSYLFNPYITIPLTIITIVTGGILNLYILKKINFSKVFNRAKTLSEKLNHKFKENEFQYALLLRFIPLPFIIQNTILLIAKISLKKFFFSTLIGVTPYVIIYSMAGFKLKELIDQNKIISIKDIINYDNFFILILLILLVCVSIFLKKKFI